MAGGEYPQTIIATNRSDCDRSSIMKTYLTFGLGIALFGALMNLCLYFLGYHNDVDQIQNGQWIGMVVGLIITVGGLFLGIRAVRENSPDKSLSFGRGVLAGLLIGLFSGVFGAVFTYVYGAIINPGFHDVLYELQIQKIQESGVPAAQVENMEGMMRFFTGPMWLAAANLFFAPIFSTIIALVLSAILKRDPAAPTPPTAARQV
jgi:FtsH-binding integral membrane protein